VVKNENKPEFSGRFFSQRLWGAKDPFTGFSVTAAFPLFGAKAYQNKIKVAQADMAVQQKQYEYEAQVLNTIRVRSPGAQYSKIANAAGSGKEPQHVGFL